VTAPTPRRSWSPNNGIILAKAVLSPSSVVNINMDTKDLFESLVTEGSAANDLFTRYGGQVMGFSQLPKPAQQSILEYMRGGGSSSKEVTGREYGLVNVPMEALVNSIMTNNDEIRDNFENFDQYHEWYMNNTDVKLHKNARPVTLSPYDDEVLQDGWHRLNAYYHQGLKTVPAILFV